MDLKINLRVFEGIFFPSSEENFARRISHILFLGSDGARREGGCEESDGLKGNWRRRRGRDVASSAGRCLSQGIEIYDHGTPHRRGNFLGDKSLAPFLALFSADRNETRPKDGGNRFPRSQTGRNLFRSRARAFPIIILNGPKCLRSLHAGCTTTAVSIYSHLFA